MEATTTKPKQSYVFDRKLTDEEVRELIDNYDYTPDFEDNGVLWDRFGNPTESMIRYTYERDHGLLEYEGPFTMDEFSDWLEEVCAEADAEMAEDEARRTKQQIPA